MINKTDDFLKTPFIVLSKQVWVFLRRIDHWIKIKLRKRIKQAKRSLGKSVTAHNSENCNFNPAHLRLITKLSMHFCALEKYPGTRKNLSASSFVNFSWFQWLNKTKVELANIWGFLNNHKEHTRWRDVVKYYLQHSWRARAWFSVTISLLLQMRWYSLSFLSLSRSFNWKV